MFLKEGAGLSLFIRSSLTDTADSLYLYFLNTFTLLALFRVLIDPQASLLTLQWC